MPAEAVITKDIGHGVANLIAAEGKELEKWLGESGIAQEDERTGSKRLDLDNLRAAFTDHCAVMAGCCDGRAFALFMLATPTPQGQGTISHRSVHLR